MHAHTHRHSSAKSCKRAALLQFSYDHVGDPDGVGRQRDLLDPVELFRVPDQELICPHLKAAAGKKINKNKKTQVEMLTLASGVPLSRVKTSHSGSKTRFSGSHLAVPDAGGDALSLSSLDTQTRTRLEAELLRAREQVGDGRVTTSRTDSGMRSTKTLVTLVQSWTGRTPQSYPLRRARVSWFSADLLGFSGAHSHTRAEKHASIKRISVILEFSRMC